MKLTRRQKDFLERFRKLYRKIGQPLHYTEVAEQLGIGNVTAYEMLRSLEKKGMVSSRYIKQPAGGPGRSQVVFCPSEGSESSSRLLELEKERIVRMLQDTEGEGREEALKNLLARLQTLDDPVSFLSTAIGALLLNLSALEDDVRERVAREIKVSLRKGSWVHVVGGIAVLLLGTQAIEHGTALQLVGILEKYYEHIASLPADKKAELAEFVREVIAAI